MRALSRMWPSWLLCLGFAAGASAQTNLSSNSGASGAPPAPVPPEVVTREGFTRVTVRATRIAEPIVLDGRLTEEIDTRVRSISDFVQQEPREGEPATEKTDVWLLFDDDNVYVSAICWDTHPERAQLKEMRRDNTGLFDNELFMVSLDTFYDRRNAFVFHVNLSGGFSEAYLYDSPNSSVAVPGSPLPAEGPTSPRNPRSLRARMGISYTPEVLRSAAETFPSLRAGMMANVSGCFQRQAIYPLR